MDWLLKFEIQKMSALLSFISTSKQKVSSRSIWALSCRYQPWTRTTQTLCRSCALWPRTRSSCSPHPISLTLTARKSSSGKWVIWSERGGSTVISPPVIEWIQYCRCATSRCSSTRFRACWTAGTLIGKWSDAYLNVLYIHDQGHSEWL